jgi:hypothetical protein
VASPLPSAKLSSGGSLGDHGFLFCRQRQVKNAIKCQWDALEVKI